MGVGDEQAGRTVELGDNAMVSCGARGVAVVAVSVVAAEGGGGNHDDGEGDGDVGGGERTGGGEGHGKGNDDHYVDVGAGWRVECPKRSGSIPLWTVESGLEQKLSGVLQLRDSNGSKEEMVDVRAQQKLDIRVSELGRVEGADMHWAHPG